jgi:hypothetical protein
MKVTSGQANCKFGITDNITGVGVSQTIGPNAFPAQLMLPVYKNQILKYELSKGTINMCKFIPAKKGD